MPRVNHVLTLVLDVIVLVFIELFIESLLLVLDGWAIGFRVHMLHVRKPLALELSLDCSFSFTIIRL